MATSRRTGTNENISTYGGVGQGRDYTSLATWETATDNNLVSLTQSEVLECYDDEVSFNDRCGMAGATTSVDYHRIIRPAGTIGTGTWEGHDGTPNNGVHFIWNTANTVFDVAENNSSVQDLIVELNIAGAANTIAVVMDAADNLGVGLILVDCTTGSGAARGYRIDDGYAMNCLVLRTDNWGIQIDSGTSYVYNCNFIDNGGDGINDGNSVLMVVKNCLGSGNGVEDFDSAGTYTGSEGNASADDSAIGTSPRINQTFTFVASGSDDYHLSASDTGAHGFGSDLSADGVFDFNDDIDGDTRS